MIARPLEGAGLSKNSFKLWTFFIILWTIIQPTLKNVQSNGFSRRTPKHGQILYEMLIYVDTILHLKQLTRLIVRALGGAGVGKNSFNLGKIFTLIQPTYKNFQSNGFSGETPKHGQIFYEMLI